MYDIHEQQLALQPRERLNLYGPESLSEQELLAIVLRTGSKNTTVYALAGKILTHFQSLHNFQAASIDELKALPGIGQVKAVELKAMIELGKRVYGDLIAHDKHLQGSERFGRRMALELSEKSQEHLVAFYLDNQNAILEKRVVYIGTVNSAPALPREILHYALKVMATSLIVVHNHPSGNLKPSSEDERFTQKLEISCHTMGIRLLDHVIVAGKSYFSFREKKRLAESR
ncbi:MAG: DNA repair protein RadC [Streptococcaceae bacterium]|jgi:DNA repair protein RadC|nr:DNA repair protein RadC [Streptococcaceae bacterium]